MAGNEAKDRVIVEHFRKLFTDQTATIPSGVLDSLHGCLSNEANSDLTRAYVESKIKEALMQMHPLKAPGPDGMSLIFFQKYWSIVGSSETKAALHSLNSSDLPPSLNHTHIVLIPKNKKSGRGGRFSSH